MYMLDDISFAGGNEKSTIFTIIICIVFALIIASIVGCVCHGYRKKKKKNAPNLNDAAWVETSDEENGYPGGPKPSKQRLSKDSIVHVHSKISQKSANLYEDQLVNQMIDIKNKEMQNQMGQSGDDISSLSSNRIDI
eukprot:441126_1